MSQTLGPRAAPRRLLSPLPAEASPRAAPSRGGAPEGASPLPPAGGLAVSRIRGGRRGWDGPGREGRRRRQRRGPAGTAGGFEAAPAPPRKRAGRGRPPGGGHGGAGPPSSSRVGGLRGGSLKPRGEGAGTPAPPRERGAASWRPRATKAGRWVACGSEGCAGHGENENLAGRAHSEVGDTGSGGSEGGIPADREWEAEEEGQPEDGVPVGRGAQEREAPRREAPRVGRGQRMRQRMGEVGVSGGEGLKEDVSGRIEHRTSDR